MNIIRVRNVHRALPVACAMLKETGVRRTSRNGPVIVAEGPVTTMYTHPLERVMFWPQRDANPFFHFYESLWMLAGRRDLEPLRFFVDRMASFSDDKETFYGAYGYRWRKGMPAELGDDSDYGFLDQLKIIGDRLASDPNDRRCVLQMWDARSDLNHAGADVPCNTMATFQVGYDGQVNLVVFCRSNDIVWGAYGANAVHMSFLLEYVAKRVGRPAGTYHQISVNWHGYENTFLPLAEKFKADGLGIIADAYGETTDIGDVYDAASSTDPYGLDAVMTYPLMSTDPDKWDHELHVFMKDTAKGQYPADRQYDDTFFTDVAVPIVRAHVRFRTQEGPSRYSGAIAELDKCQALDWRIACREWIDRRYDKFMKEHEGE